MKRNLLKSTFFLTTLLLLCATTINAQNSLKAANVSAGPGDKSKISIELNNTGNVVGFQFTITVPSGLVVSEKAIEFTSRKGDHIVYPSKISNTQYLFISFSPTNEFFSGNSGTLLEIPIEIPINYQPGTSYPLTLSGVILSSKEGVDIGSDHQNGTLTVSDAKTPDLEVSGITISDTGISPNGTISVSWGVKNIGKALASGTWTEQVSIVSAQTGEKYQLGSVSYTGAVNINEAVSRNGKFNIPKIPSMDGEVKVEVNLIPNSQIKELESEKENNKVLSSGSIPLSKMIFLSFNRNQIEENSTSPARATLTRSGFRNTAEVFQVSCSENDQFTFPATITIGLNQSAVTFDLQPIDNNTADGNRTVSVSVLGNGYPEASQEITIIDDEIGIVTLTSSKYSVIDGEQITITLQTDIVRTKDVTFTLTADQKNRWDVPANILLPAGTKTVSFPVGIKTLTTPEPTVTGTITAKAEGYKAGIVELTITSANIPTFEFTIEPKTISEGDGIYATYAVIKRLDKPQVSLSLKLYADIAGELILPATVNFPAGVTQQKFNIGVVDNDIVDGTRIVRVTASINLSSCGCTTGAGTGGVELSQSITILDNDGLALRVKANPSTVKAGQNNAAKITVTRNTLDLSESVDLRLSSDMTSVISIPATATIPVGQASVDVYINTFIDPGKKGDQTVRVQAEADKYASGFAWVLVSDQNKPDASVTVVAVNPVLAGGGDAEITVTIANHGNNVLVKGSKVEYYLSKNKTTQGGALFATDELDKDINAGSQLEFTRTVRFPDKAGDHFIIVVLNSNRKIDELSFANNQGEAPVKLAPAYSVTVSVNKPFYKSEETVVISGTAKFVNSNPAANKEVEIVTRNNSGFVRTSIATTNESGNYTYSLQTLPGESGHYIAAVSYPGADNHTQTEFDIAGFEWKNKPNGYLLWELTEFSTKQGEFILKNNTNVKLSDVRIILPENIDFTIDAARIDIPAGETVALSYTITPNEPTAGRDYIKIPAQLVSNEGGRLDITGWYFCHPLRAKLTPSPVSINTTMTKGTTRYYEFKLINGANEAKDVRIDIPSTDWLSMVTPQNIPLVAPYDTIITILQLRPTERLGLNVPIQGSIAVNLSNGNGFNIPFKIETVSEATGSILVDVVDDYTYNTASAPHLKDAKVTIRHPYSGVIIAEGLTGNNGLFSVSNVPEGYYTISISAKNHSNYQNNILIDPGKENRITAFLAYQAISYTWNVVPTEIEDEYQTDIIVEFETNVPRPVVVFEYDKTEIDLQPGESKILDIAVTNKGLIKAVDVKITVPEAPGYTFTLLADYFPSLNAKSTVVVPLLIQKDITRSGAIAGCYAAIINGTYLVVCGPENYEDIATGKIPLKPGAADCSLPGSPGGSGTPAKPPSPGTIPSSGGSSSNEGSRPGSYDTGLGCNECTWKLIKELIGCNNPGGLSDLKDCVEEMVEVWVCFNGNPSFKSGFQKNILLRATTLSFLELMEQDFTMIAEAAKAMINKNMVIYFDADFINSDNFTTFEREVITYINNQQTFSATDIMALKNKLAATSIANDYIDNFCNRWNLSIEAWNKGMTSPNSQYPDIVDKNLLNSYDAAIVEFNAYLQERGFSDIMEMYKKDHADLMIFAEQDAAKSVCATVTVKFSQTITMTREAFEGTLTLNNGNAGAITGINLDLIVYDENGEDATHLFQVNKDAFLSGSGNVGNNSTGTGTVIFIPTKYAAPTVPLSYSFGGILSYNDPGSGEKVTARLYPVTLEVNPSPDLVLHYFMQRDILGDDPLTEDIVEPSIPAELALMIINEGYGLAKNVRVESMQPEIIENQKGLLIDFTIIGSNFNNEPKQLGLLNVNFGNIEPQKSAIGQWWFTSTLMGHFVDYKINVTHLSSFGNKNLSLIKDYQLHELIRNVKAYGTGHDEINDFLVNDIPDVYDTPDRIYYSNGDADEVYSATGATVSNAISSLKLTATLSVTPYMSIGWNYGNIDDPGRNQYKLVKVVRNSDNYELPLENFWQTFVTLRDGRNPLYENKLHFLDKFNGAAENYTLYYIPIDNNYPKVVSFENVPKEMSELPVENIIVKFNKPIDVSTFTTDNLQLIYQGGLISTENILIGKIEDDTYSLNLQAVTTASGYYELTVQCYGIKDLVGNEGQAGKSVNWIQVLGELGILSFSTDQVKSQPVNSVEIFFNKTVDPNQFTKDKITLNGETLGDNVSILTDDKLHYTILGLSAYNNSTGSYELSVDLPAIKSENNIAGIVAQSCKWRVDVVMPAVKYFTPLYQGAVNSQNITNMKITLTKPIVNDFEAGWITFYKGSENQNAQLSVAIVDSITYLINGLGTYSHSSGGYRLSVDQTGFVDELGNFGTGSVDTMWVVSITKPAAPTNMKITPDRGASSVDNITSGNDLSINLTTNANQQTVSLYTVSSQGETLVKKQYVENAGVVSIPITGYSGKITFLAITSDIYGNESNQASIEVFIDNQDLSAEITAVNENDSGCADELSYVSILFTDDIQVTEFTVDDISMSAGGASLLTGNIVITRISDREFKVENFDNINNNGDITINVDLAGLHKKLSGMQAQGVITQNLGNISFYSTQISGDEEVVSGSVTTYDASAGMLEYSWNITGGDIIASQSNSISVRWNKIGEQTISLIYKTPNNCVKLSTLPVKVSSNMPMFLTWQGKYSNVWSEKQNWEENQAPTEMDTVIIPRVAQGNYFPVLQVSTKVAEIYFKPGAQIGNQSLLTAKAFVQYDFSKTESRDRWHMLSMPLGEAYPADFTFGGYPLTWVRTFETKKSTTAEGSITKGTWVTARASETPFIFGDGFVLWLNEDNETADKGLKLLDGIRELPFFHHFAEGSPDKELYEKVQHTHDYNDINKKSTFYNFELKNGEYVRINKENYSVPRSDGAYRLAGASVPKILDFGENVEAKGNVTLVGNPYMATLDFGMLYENNINVINSTYHIWTGEGYESYSYPDGGFGVIGEVLLDEFIAPLQAFLVEKPENQGSNSLKFLEDKMATVNKPFSLRSSAVKENKLDIIARNPVAGVLTFIAKREGGQDTFGDLDSRKIINGINNIPEVYTLKPYKGGSIAVGANIINNDELLIPIGLATSYTGNITLSFSGMNAYDATLSLIDAVTNRSIDLTGLASYDYVFDYKPEKLNGETTVCENRFFISISKTTTDLTESIIEKVNVYQLNGIIQIISGVSNPIKEVAVYNLQGALLYKEASINAISHSINRNWADGVYIVKVVSDKNIDITKLIIH